MSAQADESDETAACAIMCDPLLQQQGCTYGRERERCRLGARHRDASVAAAAAQAAFDGCAAVKGL